LRPFSKDVPVGESHMNSVIIILFSRVYGTPSGSPDDFNQVFNDLRILDKDFQHIIGVHLDEGAVAFEKTDGQSDTPQIQFKGGRHASLHKRDAMGHLQK
jgi:hypothetical protein